MASSSNAVTLKVLLCAALLLSTTVVSRGHCSGGPDCRGVSVAPITGRRMLVAESAAAATSSQLAAATVAAVSVPRLTGPAAAAAAAAAAAYSESKRASPGGPDPQHH